MDRRATRIVILVAAAVVVVAGAAAGFARGPGVVAPAGAEVAAPSPGTPGVSGDWAAAPADVDFTVADAAGPVVHLFSAPDVPYEPLPELANPTCEGLAVVFAVLERDGDWLHVRVSARPNDLTAWIRRSEVTLRTVPNRVVVEVGARRITVFHGTQVLLRDTVAVGTDATPTPLGHFFVDGIVDVPYDDGPYGAYQVSVSGFSEVLQSFGGGVGQIALHGTNRPELLGSAVSNGCVRMGNDTVTKLVELAPTGTPVEIVA